MDWSSFGDAIIIQIVSTDQIKTSEIEVSPGVKKTSRFLNFTVAGGSGRIEIADGVDVPLNFSGTAFCSASAYVMTHSSKSGNSWTSLNYRPSILVQFVAKAPVQRFSLDNLQRLMSGGESSDSSRSGK